MDLRGDDSTKLELMPDVADVVRRLQETLGKMESALGAIDDCIAWTGADGRVQWCNAAFDKLAGRAHIEILGAPLVVVLPLHEDQRQLRPDEHPLASCLRHGAFAPRSFELAADGERRFVEVSGACLQLGVAGKTAILVARDVTERHRAEEEIEYSISLLRATLESTADGIFVTDTGGGIVSHNQRFTEMWRIPERLLATEDEQAVVQFVLPQLKDPDTFRSIIQELHTRPEVESYDILELKDAKVFHAVREGCIRLSPHFYNTTDELDRALEVLARA